MLPPTPCWEQTPETHALAEFLLFSGARVALTNDRIVVACYRSRTGREDMPGGRPAKKPRTAAATAARLRACGSGAVAAAAASEGGMAEMDIEDALSLADEAQRQLEADADEMNAEHSDGSVALLVAWLLLAPRSLVFASS